MRPLGRALATTTAVIFAGVLALGLAQRLDLLPSFGNPVQETTVDRTGPTVLRALEDLSDYHGSTGRFEVVVDLEKDVKYVPSVVAGERLAYQAVGSVDGVVDLSQADGTLRTTPGGRTIVTVVVPHARLSDPALDLERSKVLTRDRGVVNRIGSVFNDSPTSEKGAQQAGEAKLADAAKQAGLRTRAEENTTKMLTQLLRSAGADEVVVEFRDPAAV